ncbi:MAG: peptidoglycan DD-metalloendopeptidase family protein [Candidatus Magasanikbacteria bacterium]|jgi:murein DD-endopeptidase MepM/ murein hydrolase activator NlpD|nr:peptidoglycan DD-metalloendopeptidase family protein [Candidatus Magasanikbacteria bacterium]
MHIRFSVILVSFISLTLVGWGSVVVFAANTEEVGGNKAEIDVLNDKIAEKKEKVKELEKSIAAYNEKINQKRKEAVSLSNQLAILDNRVSQVTLDIEITEEKIDTLELEIESLQLEIADKQGSIDRQQELIGELIRTIHYHDKKKYIEIAAGYSSFSEFYNQVQYIHSVEENLGATVRGIRISKEELQKKESQTTERKLSYEGLKQELENKKKNLGEQLFAKENLLASTHASELTYKTLLGSLKQQYSQIENEITGIEHEIRKKLESQNKLQDDVNVGDGQLTWPTPSRYITARFHDPDYPYRHVFEHNAIDIRAAHGTPIKAAASGYIARARRCTVSTCYAYTMIVHAGGISTVYGHMSRITVSEDQFVARGDVIGYTGGTPGTPGAGPFVTGPHLHFEVRLNGIPVDPLRYLVKDY